MAQIKFYNGSSWVTPKAIKQWNGSEWVDRVGKYWNGSNWVDFIKYILEDIFYVTVNGVVARRDLNGNEIWRYNRSNNGYVSMDIDKEGNFIAGNTGNMVDKYDKDGNLLWNYFIGGIVWAVCMNNDGTIYAGKNDFVDNLFKINSDGTNIWSGSVSGKVRIVISDTNKDVYVFCEGSLKTLAKYDGSTYGQIWQYIGFDGNIPLHGAIDNNGDIVVSTSDVNSVYTIWKISSSGSYKWKSTAGLSGDNKSLYKVIVLPTGEIYALATTCELIKLQSNSAIIWKKTLDPYPRDIGIDTQGNIYVGGDNKMYRITPDGSSETTLFNVSDVISKTCILPRYGAFPEVYN